MAGVVLALPLILLPLSPIWAPAALMGVVVGALVGWFSGARPLRLVLVAALTSGVAALFASVTGSLAAVVVVYVVGGLLDWLLLMSFEWSDELVVPVLLPALLGVAALIVLSFRAFEWGWYGAPIFVSMLPWIVLPGALIARHGESI